MQKNIFKSTRRNIMGMSVGIVMGTLVVFAIITQTLFEESLFDDVDQQLLTHKNMILTDMHVKYKEGQIVEVTLPTPLSRELINYVWLGNKLMEDSPHEYKGSSQYPKFMIEKNGHIVMIRDEGYEYRGIQFESQGLSIQLLLNVDAQINSLRELKRALIIAFFILSVIGLWISFILAKVTLKPIYRAYQKQAQFIQDASHEMRTPLAVIRGKIELIVRHSKDSIEMHYSEMAGIMSELSGLEKMNKDLLLLSKEDMNHRLELHSIELNEWMQEIVNFYEEICTMHDLKLCYEPALLDCKLEWDEIKVKRCLSILLENAIKYSKHQGKVFINVLPQEKVIEIQIRDEGIGIKESELPYIFNRFYRSNEVRGSGKEGSGIGLSLFQSLAFSMETKWKVESEYGKGSCFTMWIPKKMK